MPNLRKDKEEILYRALRHLEKYTPLSDFSPGSVARALVEVIAEEISDMYAVLDFNFAQGMLDRARGSGLDALGNFLGVKRISGTDYDISAGSCSFYFYLSNTPNHVPGEPNTTPAGLGLEQVVIPPGTIVSTSGDFVGRRLAFQTTDAAVINSFESMVYVGLKPATNDLLLNAGKGTLRVHSIASIPQLYCYNPKPINAVISYEDDDTYRMRIKKQLRLLGKGNRWAIYLAAMSVDGVKSVNIAEMARGLGSVDVIVCPYKMVDATSSLLNRVKASVNEVRPAGINVLVKFPSFISLSISGSLMLSNRLMATNVVDSLINRAKAAIASYINSLDVGEPLIYNRLFTIVTSLSPDIIDFRVSGYSASGKSIPFRNYDPGRDGKLFAGTISIT